MAKSDRLIRLMHLMRLLPPPVRAERLAGELGVSQRTIYRDIDSLRAAGARIEGEAGLGYTLAEDAALPPQALTRLEIEALVLGLSDVQRRGDPALARAAADTLAKIAATLPEAHQRQAAHAIAKVYSYVQYTPPPVDPGLLRRACWEEEALDITYRDKQGAETARRILPLAMVYLDMQVVLLAWCCLREGFRQFIVPAILSARPTGESFRPRRVALLRACAEEMPDLYRPAPRAP